MSFLPKAAEPGLYGTLTLRADGSYTYTLNNALPAVQALHSAGVISGMPDGSFQPQATTTREQACVVLCAL